MMGEMKMREKQGSSGAKTRIHVICAIVALLCVAVMFVPNWFSETAAYTLQ